ncbi:MAG: thermonuclease family protein [Thermomicrobiales bacterium]|nr:thermonuclease family protein [Thermomicrobiales bacterium]
MTIINRSLVTSAVAGFAFVVSLMGPGATAAEDTCASFNSWVWAQTVFDNNPGEERALDPDGDGVACDALPDGIAPATWTDAIPADAEPVDLVSVNDGDTIEVWRDNRHERVRLVGIDTHEVGGGDQQEECYGPEASRFLKALLSVGGDIWIEQDVEDRDQYGRLLRWVWADFGTGQVYLLNEALVRAGFAERYRNTPNDLYLEELLDAEAFAQAYGLGLWTACDMPYRATSTVVQGSGPRSTQAPAPTGSTADQPSSGADNRPGCDPAYPDVCVPPYPPDLSCADIPFDHIRVLPPDPHHFDGNGDGMGCEGPPA